MKTARRYTEKEWSEMIEMLNQGATYQEIAEMTGRTKEAVAERFRVKGYGITKKTPPQTPEKKLVKVPTIEDFSPRDLIKRLYDLGYRIKNNKLYVVSERVVNLTDIIS